MKYRIIAALVLAVVLIACYMAFEGGGFRGIVKDSPSVQPAVQDPPAASQPTESVNDAERERQERLRNFKMPSGGN